ncbi:MAG: ribonuclease R [Deltaproteobacteria bacterium RIFCSPLOWO2_12_FULL_60_19]|nr:MAG: ribonuclease R [Deltaproteobacteria bacterium RIFCSPLOWO2_12_FULL_60_19]
MPALSRTVKEKILSFLAARPRHRLTPLEVLKGIGARRDDLDAISDSLRELAREGRIVRLKKNHYALPQAQNCVTGRVHAHPDGYGFLIPDDKGRDDVYLNRREMRRVMHGDRVMVRMDKKRTGEEAHVAQILERGQKRLIGTYEEHDGRGYLIPMDLRVAPAIPLAGRPPKVETGKVIAAEITRYGTGFSPPEADLLETLGDPDNPEVQARAIIFRYSLPTSFSPAAKREAEICPRSISAAESGARVDLRARSTVTIDGEQARDFDDAVSIEKIDGIYHLYVSIADVSSYVAPDSALDQEAYQRATSVYFPDRALPMLPEELSNGICSLNPKQDRLTKTALLEINARGEVVKTRFFNSVICSDERMTYTDVRRILVDQDVECIERYRPLVDSFKLMEEVALLLCEQRRARGTLDFDLPEAEIVLDLQGTPENIVRAERSIAHRIIEEFMIAANEAVARHLKEKGFPLLYRIHDGPEREALEAVAPFLLSLGYRLPLKKEKATPKDLQRLLETCRGKPEERVLNHVLLRAMKQARYAPENIGHFGLASTCYTHFTSPIRRYPDLIVHRILGDVLDGKTLKAAEKEDRLRYLQEAGRHTSERERIAMDAEREMVALKKAQFMMDKIGEEFGGFVVSLASFGFFVELENYFVEGLVKLSTLEDDAYQYYEKEYIIKGRRHGRKFRLGDPVRVRVARINVFRSEIDFELV